MGAENALELQWLILPLAVVIYIHGMRLLEKLTARRGTLSDEENFTRLARESGCSEYDLFQRAAENWHIQRDKVEQDFKSYLHSGILPYYAKDYSRRYPRP